MLALLDYRAACGTRDDGIVVIDFSTYFGINKAWIQMAVLIFK